MPVGRVVSIMRQVLAALADAHYLGITHRDVKPENVLLEPRRGGFDHVKVIDFGVAKLAGDTAVTRKGRIVGSACYPYLQDYQRRWLALFQAIGARNARRMAELSVSLLGEQQTLVSEAREYLLLAALTGYVASGAKPKALELWGSYSPSVRVTQPAFRLLRCHADPAGCGKAFRAYAER